MNTVTKKEFKNVHRQYRVSGLHQPAPKYIVAMFLAKDDAMRGYGTGTFSKAATALKEVDEDTSRVEIKEDGSMGPAGHYPRGLMLRRIRDAYIDEMEGFV